MAKPVGTFSGTYAKPHPHRDYMSKVCKASRQERSKNSDLRVLGWEFQAFDQVHIFRRPKRAGT